eukprot:8882808-Pyramimonas_sp.AAC.1
MPYRSRAETSRAGAEGPGRRGCPGPTLPGRPDLWREALAPARAPKNAIRGSPGSKRFVPFCSKTQGMREKTLMAC